MPFYFSFALYEGMFGFLLLKLQGNSGKSSVFLIKTREVALLPIYY